ncbi:MAG: hypothetical protein N3E47_01710 [Candidatus Bathyarchaeota archaeon]|nr:hypothetical protein [Candidatus Bathyarchaeota archaeon]
MRSKILGMRLPLAIFILAVLAFVIAGSILFHLTLMSNLVDANWLSLRAEFLKLNFPKSWHAEKGYNGTVYVINLFSDDYKTILHFEFYSEAATRSFMESNNLTQVSSIPEFDAEKIYNWTLRQNNNATCHIIEVNSDLSNFIESWANARGYEVHRIFIKIENAYKVNNVPYNTTGLFLSSIVDRKLIKIIFYGEENSWSENQEDFKKILDSTEIFIDKWYT